MHRLFGEKEWACFVTVSLVYLLIIFLWTLNFIKTQTWLMMLFEWYDNPAFRHNVVASAQIFCAFASFFPYIFFSFFISVLTDFFGDYKFNAFSRYVFIPLVDADKIRALKHEKKTVNFPNKNISFNLQSYYGAQISNNGQVCVCIFAFRRLLCPIQ